MATWSKSELEAIGSAEELTIQTARRDQSLRDSFFVWGVRVGDVLVARYATPDNSIVIGRRIR